MHPRRSIHPDGPNRGAIHGESNRVQGVDSNRSLERTVVTGAIPVSSDRALRIEPRGDRPSPMFLFPTAPLQRFDHRSIREWSIALSRWRRRCRPARFFGRRARRLRTTRSCNEPFHFSIVVFPSLERISQRMKQIRSRLLSIEVENGFFENTN